MLLVFQRAATGLSQTRQCGDVVLRMLVTGGTRARGRHVPAVRLVFGRVPANAMKRSMHLQPSARSSTGIGAEKLVNRSAQFCDDERLPQDHFVLERLGQSTRGVAAGKQDRKASLLNDQGNGKNAVPGKVDIEDCQMELSIPRRVLGVSDAARLGNDAVP